MNFAGRCPACGGWAGPFTGPQARRAAAAGRLEAWVHRWLAGPGRNVPMARAPREAGVHLAGGCAPLELVRKQAAAHEIAGLGAAQAVRAETAAVPELVAWGCDWLMTPLAPGAPLAWGDPAPAGLFDALAALHEDLAAAHRAAAARRRARTRLPVGRPPDPRPVPALDDRAPVGPRYRSRPGPDRTRAHSAPVLAT